MARKTTRLYGAANLIGTTKEDALASFAVALSDLERGAVLAGREPLYDTLEVSIDREFEETRSIVDVAPRIEATFITIQVSAEAVKR